MESEQLGSNYEAMGIDDRLVYRRAIDVVLWSQPLMAFKAMRDAFLALGARYNDVAYYSQIQNWKFQIPTPNSTTPYILTFWDMAERGPVVVEIPAATADVGIFGTLMDSWQRPLHDVGAAGRHIAMAASRYLPASHQADATPP